MVSAWIEDTHAVDDATSPSGPRHVTEILDLSSDGPYAGSVSNIAGR